MLRTANINKNLTVPTGLPIEHYAVCTTCHGLLLPNTGDDADTRPWRHDITVCAACVGKDKHARMECALGKDNNDGRGPVGHSGLMDNAGSHWCQDYRDANPRRCAADTCGTTLRADAPEGDVFCGTCNDSERLITLHADEHGAFAPNDVDPLF